MRIGPGFGRWLAQGVVGCVMLLALGPVAQGSVATTATATAGAATRRRGAVDNVAIITSAAVMAGGRGLEANHLLVDFDASCEFVRLQDHPYSLRET